MISFPRRFIPDALAPKNRTPTSGPPGTSEENDAGFWLFVGHVVAIFGIALSNAFMGLMAIYLVAKRRRLSFRFEPYKALFLPAALFSIFFVVSALQSLDPGRSLGGLKDLLSMVTLLAAPFLVRGEKAVRRTVDLVLIMIVGSALVGIYQYLFTPYGDLHRRIIGPFSHYQTFAGVLLIGTLVLIARLSVGDGWRRPTSWLALGIVVFTLFLTLTRGAWVAAAAGLLVLTLARTRRAVVGGIAVVALVAAWLAPASWTERVSSIVDVSDPSNYDRLCMLEAGLHMIDERPLFGIGPEMVKERYPIYRHPTAPRINVPHLHNALLQRAAEQGLVGFATYLWMMVAAALLAWRGLRRAEAGDDRSADLYLAVLMVVVGFNVASLFEDNWNDTEVRRLLLFLLAIPLCLRPTAPAGAPPEDRTEDRTEDAGPPAPETPPA
ncbi:MAG: O-antigen ligase family protein [Acidobacteriota bacterium]